MAAEPFQKNPLGTAPPSTRVRVGLVDDHHLVREGLRLVLDLHAEVLVVGEAEDRESAIAMVTEMQPDVVVLDVSLGATDAIPLIPVLHARRPSLKVVVVTMHSDAETVRQALFAGAAGYVVKGARSSELVDSILAVARGERYVHSSVAAAVVEASLQWLQHGEPLSPREREILSLYAAGMSAMQIGRSLDLSVHTVRRHVANIGQKLGMSGRAALSRYALERGVVRGVA